MGRNRMAATLAALAAVALAGCLGGSDDDDANGPRVSNLRAPDAIMTRDGGDLLFQWQGELGAGAQVPLVGGAFMDQYAQAEFTVPVDATVETVRVDLHGTAAAVAMLRDPEGRLLCAARAERTCATLSNATGPRDLTLALTSLAPQGLTFDIVVRLGADPPVLGDHRIPLTGWRVHRSDEPGGEPTLAFLEDGRVLVASGSGVVRMDPDGTFTDASPPVDAALSQTLDPFLVGDPATGRVYVTQLASCMRLSWTDDGGDSWTTNPLACGGPEQHHQKIAVGPGPLGRTVHIATMNLGSWLASDDVVIFHSSSPDGGLVWTQEVAMQKDVHGMEARAVGNIATADDGSVFLIAYLCDGFVDAEYEGVAVGKSDGTGTWTWTPIAGGGGRCEGIDPGIAVDGDRVYAAWEDMSAGGGNVWWSYGQVASNAWADAFEIPTPGLGSFAFTDLAAKDGRLAAAFLATPDTGIGPTQAPGWARWFPYLATLDLTVPDSDWEVVRLQPDPVQIGPICMDGPMCLDGARNLLDFIDVQFGPEGEVGVAYADGCEGDCAYPWQSRGSDLRVAIVRG